jgi:hypothetical protein
VTWGATKWPPPIPPQRSSRPGEAVALLYEAVALLYEAVALLGVYAGSLNPCRASSFQAPSCFCQT